MLQVHKAVFEKTPAEKKKSFSAGFFIWYMSYAAASNDFGYPKSEILRQGFVMHSAVKVYELFFFIFGVASKYRLLFLFLFHNNEHRNAAHSYHRHHSDDPDVALR